MMYQIYNNGLKNKLHKQIKLKIKNRNLKKNKYYTQLVQNKLYSKFLSNVMNQGKF